MQKSIVAVTRDANGKPVDLHEEGALEALFEFNRSKWGGWTMKDDDDDDDDGDDDGDDNDSDDDADDDDNDDDGDDDELTPAMRAAIVKEANRIADRRINQMNRRQRRKKAPRDNDDDNDDNSRNRNRNNRDDDKDDGPSESDAREARLIYRESVADHITISRDERPIAQDLSRALIGQNLQAGMDVVDAGEAAAEDVAKNLKRLRTSVRDLTIRRLKRDGALPEDFVLKSQPKRGRQRPGKQEPNAKSGETIAKGIFADRVAAREQQNK